MFSLSNPNLTRLDDPNSFVLKLIVIAWRAELGSEIRKKRFPNS